MCSRKYGGLWKLVSVIYCRLKTKGYYDFFLSHSSEILIFLWIAHLNSELWAINLQLWEKSQNCELKSRSCLFNIFYSVVGKKLLWDGNSGFW